MKKPIIVFDLDGTLISTMEKFADIAATLIEQTFDNFDFAKARQAYIDTSGIPFHKQLEVIFPRHPSNAQVASAFEKKKLIDFFDEAPAPKNIQMLQGLKAQGFLLIVSSNNFDHLVKEYADKHFPDIFHTTLGFKEGFAKGKAHFDQVTKALEITTKDLLFVADSLSDYRLANELGIDFVGVKGIFDKHDFAQINPEAKFVNHLWELPTFLEVAG